MKIAVLLYQPGPNLNPLFQLLGRQKGVDLTVYYRNSLGVKAEYDPAFGVTVDWGVPVLGGYNYKILRNYFLRPSDQFWGGMNFGIAVEIWRNKFDAILIHGWNSLANWLAFFTAFLTRTPVFLSSESPLNQEILKSKWKLFIKKIIFGKIFFPYIAAFLYIGEENRKFYKHYGVPDKKLFFYPYAADNERLMRESNLLKPSRDKLKKELGFGAESMAIVFVGRLVIQKNPLNLLTAYEKLSQIKNLKSKVSLVFVGEGILRPELEKYIKKHNLKNVILAGFQNKINLMKYFAASDVFVLPSGMGETWGMVVNEAMCFGLPIIISNIVGSGSDLVKNGENGFIISKGDIDKLAEYLKFLVDNPEKRLSFGKKSLDINGNYNYEKDVEGILKALAYIEKND